MNIGDRVLFLYNQYIMTGSVIKNGRKYVHIKPDEKRLPLAAWKSKPELLFPEDSVGVVIHEGWKTDRNSYRIETKLYPQYAEPLKEYQHGKCMSEHSLGLLYFPKPKPAEPEVFTKIVIEKFSFDTHISEEFKQFGMENRLWESKWGQPRFLRYWRDKMTFKNGIDIYIAKVGDSVVGMLAHEKDNKLLPMYLAETGRAGGWVRPKPTEYDWCELGSIGVYVKNEFRSHGIASQLFDELEKNLQIEHGDNQFPTLHGTGDAYSLMRRRSKWIYPVDFIRKGSCFYEMAKDIQWLKNLSDRDKLEERGPFFNTPWKFGNPKLTNTTSINMD